MKPQGFATSPFFAIRTPLLPFEDFEAWAVGATAPAALADPVRLERAVEEDRKSQRLRLQEIVRRPEVREALFLASPDLDEALEAWFREPDSEKGQRAERAVVKYVSRMATRATPFGLFAGSSVGLQGQKTRLLLEPRGKCRRHSRLDMDYLFALGEALGRDPLLRGVLRFRPNSTIYPDGNRLRYVESGLVGGERSYHLVSVEDSQALRAVLDEAASGSTFEALAASLLGEDVNREEAEAFVGELVDEQVLVPSLGLTLTGPEPVAGMIAGLSGDARTAGIASSLEGVLEELAEIDASPLGIEPGRYRCLASSLEGLPARPELARLLQVDLVKSSPAATLGPKVQDEVRRGVDLLRRIVAPRPSNLEPFREAFEERYGDREIPLVEALDEESGIGYPAYQEEDAGSAPLLRGVEFASRPDRNVRWGKREKHLLTLLNRAIEVGRDEIVLDETDLALLAAGCPAPLPGAFVALVRIAAPSEDALDRGDFRIVLDSAGGPSGARFLGRFCHADPELRRLVEDHLRAEEAREPDAVFAEIVHLPERRTGNVILRPLLREYEIPFLGESGAPADRQIPVTDLLVSVRGGEICLRSERLGRRVIPRMTTAHNYVAFGLAPYRFLCALQEQSVADGLLWDWGVLGSAPFLPRVRSGRVVLSLARWTVGRDELVGLANMKGARRFSAISEWRKSRRVPRFVHVADPGSELLFDLDSVLGVEAFVHLVKERHGVELTEMLPGPKDLCAFGPEGRYVHEILIPCLTEAASPRPVEPAAFAVSPAGQSRRSFPPGSEWLYAKLYGGGVTLDRALRDTVGSFAQEMVSSGVADRWFFVRYADPRTHLRLRLHGEAGPIQGEALPALRALFDELHARRQVWRVQLDTYEREVERYGGTEGVEACEGLFYIDSEAVLEALRMLEPGEAGEEERWRLALLGAEALLRDFEPSPARRKALLARLRKGFGAEFGEESSLRSSVGSRCRSLAGEVAALLDGDGKGSLDLGPGVEVFRRRSDLLQPVVARLAALRESGRLRRGLESMVADFLHMHLNRIFTSSQRRHEMVVYELLDRRYSAVLGRAGSGSAAGGRGGSRLGL